MKNIKIIFFDIDGTLLKFGHTQISEKVKETLLKLQKKGIKLFLCTGRPSFVIPTFEGITFDGAICFNGQYAFDQNKVLFKHRLDKKDLKTLIENANKLNHKTVIASSKRMLCNGFEETLEEYFSMLKLSFEISDEFEKMLENEDIYEAILSVQDYEYSSLLKNIQTLQTVSWWPKAVDVIAKDCSKGIAIEKVLSSYGFSKEESMAFGDGENDIEMLKSAGCGIAMQNAKENVKKVADYITDSVEEDGIVSACKHFKLI